MDQTELILAARTDSDAFGQLYDQTAPSVYRFAYSLVRDHHRAEDLVSETYRRAIVRLSSYEDTGRPFHAWLFTIARNLAIDGARRGQRESPFLGHDSSDDNWLGTALVRDQDGATVRAALARLTEVHREVLVLRFGHEWSCRQVAEQLGKTEPAIKQMSFRALARLRELLEEDGYVRNP
ncbi:MAG: RNA polymerase sigma factor [Anaerolineaceae bacterium]